MIDGSDTARLDALEARLTSTETGLATARAELARAADELAVLRLLASYSPRVDSGDADGVAELWTDDGVYDVDTGVLEGHEGLREMVHGTRTRDSSRTGAGTSPACRSCCWTGTARWRPATPSSWCARRAPGATR